MLKSILAITMLFAAFLPAKGRNITDSLNYKVRFGYNIGGTSPLPMPATIRKLNKYTLQPNYSLGFDVQKNIKGRWGAQVGLLLENKGMKTDAKVMNYRMSIVRGGESLKGYFTGNNVTKVELWMLTLPVVATYSVCKNVNLKLGPYFSYITSRTFEGYVYNGYLRENTPIGAKIDIGSTKDSRGTFDFSENMRRFQFGIDAGADWRFSKRWGVSGDITWGLTGIHKSSFHTIEQTLYPIFGTIGITYKLK